MFDTLLQNQIRYIYFYYSVEHFHWVWEQSLRQWPGPSMSTRVSRLRWNTTTMLDVKRLNKTILTPWMISKHFSVQIKWDAMKESTGKSMQTHKLLFGNREKKKRKIYHTLSNLITSFRWKGTEKHAIVPNSQALIWIQTTAKFKEFLHLETQESQNPDFKFKSLGVLLCLSSKRESRPVKTADCVSDWILILRLNLTITTPARDF